jgi:membrane protease YdiL (CAAX protease family)
MNSPFSIQAALGIVALSILSAFIAGGLVLAIGLSNPDSSQKFYTFLSFIIGQGFMIIPLFWFLKSRRQPILKRLRLNAISYETLVYTIMLSLGIIILSDELDRMIQSFFPAPEYIVDLNGLLRPDTLLGFILLFIAVAIVAPVGEELLFRGFFQQALEKHWNDVTRAILMTALLFSMIHMNPYWFAQIYILGVLLGYIAWKSKSVIPALVLHGMNNAMAMLFAFVDFEKNNFYIWEGHVAPWVILFAIFSSYYGFKGINQVETKL